MNGSNDIVFSSTDGNILTNALGVVVAFGAVAIVFGVIFGLVWYVLQALGFYKMSKNRGIEPAWIAWIPICQNYLLGELIGNKVWGFGYAKWILVGIPAVSILIESVADNLSDFVSIVLLIVLAVFYVYMMTAMYKLYQIYSKKPVLLLVLSIIFPFLASIFIFAIRNHEPDMNLN